MGIFKPAWQSENLDRALKAVKRINSQAKLIVIAKNTELDIDIRETAASKIIDDALAQEIYADIAKKLRYFNISSVDFEYAGRLLERVNDQQLLTDIAKTSTNDHVRIVAADKLADKSFAQCVYAEIVKSDNTYSGNEALKRLNDQALIFDVAMNSRYFRFELAEKLEDKTLTQEVYADIAKTRYNNFEKHKAADRLTDRILAQKIYAEIIISDSYYTSSLLEKITDPNLIADIAIHAGKLETSSAALAKLTDQNLIYNIAINALLVDICIEAADKLTDETLSHEVYTNIAKNNKSELARIEAADKLTDKALALEVYADVAKNGLYCRMEAADKLTDRRLAQTIYTDIAIKDYEYGLAAMKITDQDLLFEVIKKSKFKEVRESVIKSLTDQNILTEIINGSETEYVYIWETIEGPSFTDCFGSNCVNPVSGYRCNDCPYYKISTNSLDLRETARERLAELKTNS